jgi:hypothetical protein
MKKKFKMIKFYVTHIWVMCKELIDDEDFTLFGKIVMWLVLGLIGVGWTILIIPFIPLFVFMFKYDEGIYGRL